MIRVYAVKSILPSEDDIEDPQLEISLDEAKAIDPNAEVGGEVRFLNPLKGWAASPRRSPSRSSSRKSVKPSATRFTTSTSDAWAKFERDGKTH